MALNKLITEQEKLKYRVLGKQIRNFRARYSSLYRSQMLSLYDQHFITNPTLFHSNDWISLFQDLEITPATWNGSFSLTSSHLLLLIRKGGLSEEAESFLQELCLALMFREEVQSIDAFYEELGFTNTSSRQLSFRMYFAGGQVISRYDKTSWTEGTISVLLKQLGQVDEVSLSHTFLSEVRAELGLDDSTPLLEGIPADQEDGLWEEFLDENVRKSPEFYQAVAEKFPHSNKREVFYQKLLPSLSTQFHRATKSLLLQLQKEEKEVLVVSNKSIFFKSPSEEVLYSPASYVSLLLEEREASPESVFYVPMGDYISIPDAREFGGAYGAPTEIDGELYYDNEQMKEPLVPYLEEVGGVIEVSTQVTPSLAFARNSLEGTLDRARTDLERGNAFLFSVPAGTSLADLMRAGAKVTKETGW